MSLNTSTNPAIDQNQTEETATDRAATNRANSQHSTGPRTPEGKARVRFNAVQHGLYSEAVVLPHEDFEKFTRSLIDRFAPVTEHEYQLLQTLRNTEWRLGRVLTLESGILALATEEHLDIIRERWDDVDDLTAETLAQSAGYLARAKELDQLSRHEARLMRLRDRTERELNAVLTLRRGSHFEPAEAAAAHKPAEAPQSGFVPSDFSAPPPQPAAHAPKYDAPMPKFTGPLRKQHRKQWIRAHALNNNVETAA